jgi:hypothetical protein
MLATPRFSRHTLTLIMLVTVVMIALMANQGREKEAQLPPAPALNIDAFRTDSGTPVWFAYKRLPLHLARLSCMAGSAFAPAGEAYALQQLLNQQAVRGNLPLQASLDRDNLYLDMQLATDPWQLKKQLNALTDLLWHPALPNTQLAELRHLPLLVPGSDALFNTLREHAYGYASVPSDMQLGSLSRVAIQTFAHNNVHPARCQLTLLADLSPQAARVLAESLLPISTFLPSQQVLPPLPHMRSLTFASLPPLNPGDNLALLVLTAWAENQHIPLQRTALGAGQIWSMPPDFKIQLADANLKKELADAKRTLVKRWLRSIEQPAAEVQVLSTLQRQAAPLDFFAQSFALLRALDSDTLRATAETWLIPPQDGTTN